MYKKIGLSLAYFLPAVTFATGPTDLKGVICLINEYLGYIIPLLFSIALVFFIIGIVKFFVGGEEKLAEAKQMALWGIIGLFVMFSVWGLVNILINTFGFSNQIPGLRGPGSTSGAPACGGSSSGNIVPAFGGQSSSQIVPAFGGQNSGANPGQGILPNGEHDN